MIKTKRINNFKVSKIRHKNNNNNKKIKGGNLLPNVYSNMFIVAKKNSGKTTCIFNILKKIADRDTIFNFFVSTIHKDKSWEAIVEYFENKGNMVYSNSSTIDNGECLIQNIIDEPLPYEEEEEESSSSESDTYIHLDNPEKEIKIKTVKKRKKKHIAPHRIIVLDDLSGELKRPVFNQLLKINRHLKCVILCSSQWLNDIHPMSRRQIDGWIIFGGQKKEKLNTIMRDSDSSLDYNLFERLYKHATNQKYNFLYIDCHNSKYRKNFNEEYIIHDD